MKHNKSIKVKAIILLLVFTTNTLVGFACSMGLNMGYNKHHHEGETAVPSKMQHNHHDENDGAAKHHHNKPTSQSSNDDCCSHEVTGFNLLDKTVEQSLHLVNPVFFTAIVAVYAMPGLFLQQHVIKDICSFARNYHQPGSDIRIAIQSFLI